MLRSKLNSDRFSKVSLARRLFESGLSHPKASYFLLRGQKKVTKEKAARCRFFLALLAFDEGCQKGLPVPLATRCIHAAPLWAVLAESCGARRGKRDKIVRA
jgi:hypothetical protein